MARLHGADRGIVEKPPGSKQWWVRLYVNGREKWYSCDNKTQAKNLYQRLKQEIKEKRYEPEKYEPAKDITLRAWIDRCLEGSTARGSRNEKRHGRFWKHVLGKRLLSDIATEDLKRIQSRLHEKGEKRPATINRYFEFLRRVLYEAVDAGLIGKNPARVRTKRKSGEGLPGLQKFPESSRTRFFSGVELAALKKSMEPKDWDLVAFAVEAGLRREEQFHLRWENVSIEARTITIPISKSGKTRHVPLTPLAVSILGKLDSFLHSPWVFPNPKNPALPRSAQAFVNKVFDPALDRAGIRDDAAVWHCLRHTAASRRVMAGVDLKAVQEFLGHLDIKTTLRYSHLSPDHLRRAVECGSLEPVDSAAKAENSPETPFPTGSKTGSKLHDNEPAEGKKTPQPVEKRGET